MTKLKVGDKLCCYCPLKVIDIELFSANKQYIIEDVETDRYVLKNNEGQFHQITFVNCGNWFFTLKEHRRKKLLKLFL